MSLDNNKEKKIAEKTSEETVVYFALNSRVVIIYYDDFFVKVYKSAFDKYGLQVYSFPEINTETLKQIAEIDPLVIVVIDDYLGRRVNYGPQIEAKIKNAEITKRIPIILSSDREPSEIVRDIAKIYSLNQNQK